MTVIFYVISQVYSSTRPSPNMHLCIYNFKIQCSALYFAYTYESIIHAKTHTETCIAQGPDRSER